MPNEPENNSSSSSSSSSTEPEHKPRKPRGPFDQAKVDKIDEARDIIAAYRKPEFKQILIDKRDVFEADVNDLEALCDRAERSITGGHAATVLKEQLTAEEAAARAVMNAVIDLVQRGALRTFRGEQRARLGVYFIGEDVDSNLGRLKIIAKSILDRIAPGENNAPPLDVLRGVKTDDITRLANAYATLTAKDKEQGDAQNLSKTEHKTADELLAEVMAGKLDIQLAADQEWPWTTREFDVIRDQFKLPRTRPMTE
jgi:hypothetical protein